MNQACASAITATGIVTGLSSGSTAAVARKGSSWAMVVAVHTRSARRSVRVSARGRQ